MQQVIIISPDELHQMIDLAIERKFAKISLVNNKELLSIKEASELTGIALKTFYNLTSEGKIPNEVYLKSGKKLVFRRTELLEWFEKRNSTYVNYKKEEDTNKGK